MDELEHFGFIPNGGRIYYLNRSQPPLFIHVRGFYCVQKVMRLGLRLRLVCGLAHIFLDAIQLR